MNTTEQHQSADLFEDICDRCMQLTLHEKARLVRHLTWSIELTHPRRFSWLQRVFLWLSGFGFMGLAFTLKGASYHTGGWFGVMFLAVSGAFLLGCIAVWIICFLPGCAFLSPDWLRACHEL